MLRNRWFWVVLVVALAAGGAAVALTRRAQPEASRPQDPALGVARALFVLERSPHKLSDEQVREIVPLLKVMRDMGSADELANRAVAVHMRSLLTPRQRAYLEERRQAAGTAGGQGGAQTQGEGGLRRGGGQFGGRPGSQPGGAQGQGASRSPATQPGGAQGQGTLRGPAARERLLNRVIEMLEAGG